MHRVRPPQSRRTALRHADVVEQALFDEGLQVSNDILDRARMVNAGTLEEVDALEPAERGLDRCRAAPEVFWSVRMGLSLGVHSASGNERTKSWEGAASRGSRP